MFNYCMYCGHRLVSDNGISVANLKENALKKFKFRNIWDLKPLIDNEINKFKGWSTRELKIGCSDKTISSWISNMLSPRLEHQITEKYINDPAGRRDYAEWVGEDSLRLLEQKIKRNNKDRDDGYDYGGGLSSDEILEIFSAEFVIEYVIWSYVEKVTKTISKKAFKLIKEDCIHGFDYIEDLLGLALLKDGNTSDIKRYNKNLYLFDDEAEFMEFLKNEIINIMGN